MIKIALTATPSAARFAPILCRGSVEEAFALAGELGYDGVELHLRAAEAVDEGEVKALQARYRLAVPTLGTGMAAGEDGLTFSNLDPDVRRAAVGRVAGHIRLAAAIGSAVTIGLIRGKLGGDAQAAARRAALVECLAECCRLAEAEGVTLLVEPVNRYETDDLNRLEQVARLIGEIGSPSLRILADTFHMNIEEVDIVASLQAQVRAGLLGHVHLVDSNRRVPGHGHLDMGAIVGGLLAAGYAGFLCFESLPLPDTRSAAADGIGAVRALLPRPAAAVTANQTGPEA